MLTELHFSKVLLLITTKCERWKYLITKSGHSLGTQKFIKDDFHCFRCRYNYERINKSSLKIGIEIEIETTPQRGGRKNFGYVWVHSF